MRGQLLRSLKLAAVLLVLCAVLYPLAGLAVSQVAFAHQANGSLTALGSTEVGQPWNDGHAINPDWFNGRPDADDPLALNGVGGETGAANLGPRSAALVAFVRTMVAEWRAVGVDHPTADLVTSSGSGVDPDISPADALVQVPMVARARHLAPATVRALVARETHPAQFGFLGAPDLNVLALNAALANLVAGQSGGDAGH